MISIRSLGCFVLFAISTSVHCVGSTFGTFDAQRLRPRDEFSAESYGSGVAASGNTAIIGHRGFDNGRMTPFGYYHGTNEGIAEVYTMDNSGVWNFNTTLRGSAVGELDNFGSSVAVDGNLALVGGVWASAGAPNSGSAWLFESDKNGNWREVTQLKSSSPKSGGAFATSVAVSNRRLAVSAVDEGENGVVHIFEEDAGKWRELEVLESPVPAIEPRFPGDRTKFGHSISMYGDTLVVGDHDATRPSPNIFGSGAAYIYQRDSIGVWNFVTSLGSDDSRDGEFGISVSVWGDTLAIGCGFTSVGSTDAGAVYIFKEDSVGDWNKVARLALGDQSASAAFGQSVSVRPSTVLVGAARVDYEGFAVSAGAAFLYRENAHGEWAQSAELNSLYDSGYNDNFGYSVALAEHAAFVASPTKYDSQRWRRIGAVYAYPIPEPTSVATYASLLACLTFIRRWPFIYRDRTCRNANLD